MENNKGKLPDFLIIGAQKGGTTSLWENLKKHPDIEFSPNFVSDWINNKEVYFFNDDKIWNKGINWYKSLFNNNEKLQGECTPGYICPLKSHNRMFSVVPDAKLILILRNPIDRAYSAYNHQIEEGKIWYPTFDLNDSFEEAINKCISKNEYLDNSTKNNNSIIYKGFYIEHIEHLLKFYKKEQLLILISEQMRENPKKVFNKIFDFLGVERVNIEYIPNVNSRKYKEPIKEQIRDRLKKIYEPYNERLFEFLGYKIKEWI